MKKIPFYFFMLMLLISCDNDTFMKDKNTYHDPTDLKYMEIDNAREKKKIVSGTPTVSTGGLIPYFEIVNGYDGNGNILDDSFMNYISVLNADTTTWELVDKEFYPITEEGDTLTGGLNFNLSNAGVITVAEGHPFTTGDYYFTIKVTTQTNNETYSTVFDKAFHLYIVPLLPTHLIYQPKAQNLVYGDNTSKTKAPIIPLGTQEVIFSLGSDEDKLRIESETGIVSLQSDYSYSGYDTIKPIVNVISTITEEMISFPNSLTVIVTDTPQEMPLDYIYFFYPTLRPDNTGAYPMYGDGFTIQTIEAGMAVRIWGIQVNSIGSELERPEERPEENEAARIQQPLETQTYSSSAVTQPVTTWCITTTQDLTPYNYGYQIIIGYHYMSAYLNYMADGRTPTDLEVYISTDYTGGQIQNADGTWTNNGTWTKINEKITCAIGSGTSSAGRPTGAPWGTPFIGTPYPGDQSGADPDGKKNSARNIYGKWIKCNYDVTEYKECQNFTVAFRVTSYFDGELYHNAEAAGRGGSYFIADFHYVAVETVP